MSGLLSRSATAYKFRHYQKHESGLDRLVWASMGHGDYIDLSDQEVFRGSKRDLEIINDAPWNGNALADEGEVDILDVYFDTQAVRANTYFALLSAAPGETTTMATMSEIETPGTSGYNRIAVARGTDWGAPTAGGGTTSTTKQFAATGAWTAATDLALVTALTGTAGLFIAWSALSQTRTLGNGDTLDVSMTVSAE